MVTAMSYNRLVCFPVVLSNKSNMFIAYGNMWKKMSSNVLLCSLDNCMKLFFVERRKKFKVFCNGHQEQIFHNREAHSLRSSRTQHMVLKTLKDISQFTELLYSEL